MNYLQYILFTGAGCGSLYFLSSPEKWIACGICAAFVLFTFLRENSKTIVKIGGLNWKEEDFVRGWLITGKTGSGKTQCAINHITFQIFKNVSNWGGICLDQKGLYWEILVKIAAHFGREKDLVLLQTRPKNAPEDWTPPCTINITGDPNVPASTYAKVICDTAQSLTGGKSNNPFFPVRAQLAIQSAFEVLRFLGYPATIPNVYSILRTPEKKEEVMQELQKHLLNDTARAILGTFQQHFDQPPEQRGGVEGTIDTYLQFFINPEIANVFCAENPTFSINEMDQGKIVCIALSQKYQTERLYINTILKLSYYFHALSRFDNTQEERQKDNLLILFADEGQEILTGAETAFADHRAAGVIREAKCTIVLATQAYSSILAALDKKYADVFMLNMSNEIILTVANQPSAEIASKNIGERETLKRSWSWGKGNSYNYQHEIVPYYKPHQLRKLPKFTAIIRHCEKGHRRRFIPPINPDGLYPSWFLNHYPHYGFVHLLQKIFSKRPLLKNSH